MSVSGIGLRQAIRATAAKACPRTVSPLYYAKRRYFGTVPLGPENTPTVCARLQDPKHPGFHVRGKPFDRPLSTKELEALEIGIGEHREPKGLLDSSARWSVRALRVLSDRFFGDRYLHHAVVLETVAAVPGMVGGVVRHLRSLRRMAHDGGWINHLLHEAENERMHLLTWMKICQPTGIERFFVVSVQGLYFGAFLLAYFVCPRWCHRFVGYLEEIAVESYTDMIRSIDEGKLENVPAPDLAIQYWNLPKEAKLRDVALAVRVDEAQHRDVNHHLADRVRARREDLREPFA